MTEIKAVEGLYWVLDELHKRFPGIVIDNCASGGRRLDIEMMRRSIPLWPTDMQCTPDFDCESLQELSAGLNMWLPVFGWGTHFRPGDTYNFRCNLASGMNNHIAMYEYVMPAADHPWDWQRKMLADHRRAQPLLSGDYYPLLGQSYDRAHWMILEFYRSDLGRGVLNIMRRSESDYKSAVILLQGLDAGAVYMLEDADTGIIGEFSGDSLMNTGINIDIPAKRSARLIFFSKK
jgi:alpha-galactosidase